MSANAEAPPGPEMWQAQALRLIAFPREPQSAVPQTWWRDLTGAEPENVNEKRQKHEKVESGIFEGASLTLGFDLHRIQWTVSPRLDADLGEQPRALGAFIDRKDWFHGLMDRWLLHCQPIRRLAFTASLLQPVENRQAGYELLDRYLRCVEIDPESTELLYRINRRITSGTGIQGLVINRLSTWAVAKFTAVAHVMQLPDVEEAGGHFEQQYPPVESSACALELDINTTPEFQGLLPQAELVGIFAELVHAGVEIATRGDTRP